MATLLGQRTFLRGTVAFMAPEIERPKTQTFPLPRLTAEAAHDVFALGLTLAHFWSVSSSCGHAYPWVERCITPHLEQGSTFNFQSMASTTAGQLYTDQVKLQLNRCLRAGGPVDKLYLQNMPYLHKIKIAQMADSDPRIRVSMSNAFAYFKVAQMLEGLLTSPGERERRQLEVAGKTILLRLCLHKIKLKIDDLLGPQGQAHAHQALKALQDLALFGPAKRAASLVATPVSLEAVLDLSAPPMASSEEVENAKQELQAELEWDTFSQETISKGRDYVDHVDAVFGLDLQGLEILLQQEIAARKLEAASVAVAKAVHVYLQQEYEVEPNKQLLEETPEPADYEYILKSVGADPNKANNLQTFLKERVFTSFVSWASADRLVRLSLRRCVSSSPLMLSVHQDYAAGKLVAEKDAAAFRECVWQHLVAAAQETHHGLPWAVSTALADFGASEAQVSAYVKGTLIKKLAETAWTTDNARKLLQLQIRRAVFRVDLASLPENVNLRGVYAALLTEMHKDRFVPLPFGQWQERQDYTEAMYGLTLQQFRETLAYTATREVLIRQANEFLTRMQPQNRAALTASTLRASFPESLTAPKRYAATEEAGEAIVKEALEEALTKARKGEGEVVDLRVTVNGALLRSAATNGRRGRPSVKTLKIHANTTAGYLNQHFTQVLQNSLAPGCSRYTAVLKRLSSPGSYEAVDTSGVISDPAWQTVKLRLFAVPPESGSNARLLNNCFIWTEAILSQGTYSVPPPPPQSPPGS
ncbi:hypothetical protein Esti_000558 [Eimeria stiedai]